MPRATVALAPAAPLTDAMTHLESLKRSLELQLQAADAALESLRRLVHDARSIPVAPASRKGKEPQLNVVHGRPTSRKAAVPPPPLPSGGLAERIVTAIARHTEPVRLSVVADAVGLKKTAAPYQLQKLVRAGRVVASGTTLSRRYSLPTAAKEAP